MATRLYFPSTTNENAVSPAYTGFTAANSKRTRLSNVKGTTAITTGSTIDIATTNALYVDTQFVSTRMNAGIVFTSGVTTAKAQAMCREFAANDNVDILGIVVKIVSEDGNTVRATLWNANPYVAASEHINNATCRNRTMIDGDACGASYTTVLGDRLVVEVCHVSTVGGTTPQGAVKWGENATDLPENNTQTTDGAGWVEFSNTITFAGEIVDKTQTGKAAIRVTTDKTQTGLSRITKVIDTTQTGKSRIQKSVDTTQSGVARIQKSVDVTQSGVANIQAPSTTTDQTQSGVARITKTVDATQQGTASIQNTTDVVQSGVARITITTDQVQSGLSRITKIIEVTQSGIARINSTVDVTQPGKSSIQNTTDRTQSGVARIQNIIDVTQDGVANIHPNTSDKNITGVAMIIVTGTEVRTITGKASIQNTTDQVQTGVARVSVSIDVEQDGISRIEKTVDTVINGVANIIPPITDITINGVARIEKTIDENISGVASIITGVYNFQCNQTETVIDGQECVKEVANFVCDEQKIIIQSNKNC